MPNVNYAYYAKLASFIYLHYKISGLSYNRNAYNCEIPHKKVSYKTR